MKQYKEIPAGYKDSPLGIIPEDWQVKKLDELGVFLKGKGIPKDKIKSFGNPCLTYGDIYTKYNFVIKNIKSFIDDSAALESQKIEFGDILFAGSGETIEDIGKCVAYIDKEIAFAGGDIIIFKPYESESITLSYLLNSSVSNKQKYKFGQGHSIVHIYPFHLKKIEIVLPTLPEQKKIAEILFFWDKAIEKQEQLVEKLERRKRAIMQPIMRGKIRLSGFAIKWGDTELGDLLDYIQPTPYLVRDTLYDNKYPVPVLTAGKTFVLGYTNEIDGVFVDLPVIIFDDFTTASKFVNFPFKAKSSAMKLLKAKKNVNIKFVYEAMQQIKYAIGGHERHWISKFSYITIPLPGIEEQNKIAEIISCIDTEIDLAREILGAFRSQKNCLMQKLLTGKTRVKL